MASVMPSLVDSYCPTWFIKPKANTIWIYISFYFTKPITLNHKMESQLINNLKSLFNALLADLYKL